MEVLAQNNSSIESAEENETPISRWISNADEGINIYSNLDFMLKSNNLNLKITGSDGTTGEALRQIAPNAKENENNTIDAASLMLVPPDENSPIEIKKMFLAVSLMDERLQRIEQSLQITNENLAAIHTTSQSSHISRLPAFPLTCQEDFVSFNATLEDAGAYAQMISYIRSVGGKSNKHLVRSVKVISAKVATAYTWHGMRGKEPLKATKFGECLIQALNDKLTCFEISEEIGNWLRHTTDRNKKKKAVQVEITN